MKKHEVEFKRAAAATSSLQQQSDGSSSSGSSSSSSSSGERGRCGSGSGSGSRQQESRRAGAADLDANRRSHEVLNVYKNQITGHYKNKTWDLIKRYTNTYELVNKLPVPVSRSYFKLWEMMVEHEELVVAEGQPALFIAEGPGGFVEAYVEFVEKKRGRPPGAVFCNTLISSQRHVPVWKIPTPDMASAQLRFMDGPDGPGDIYSLANVDAIVRELGRGSMALVTADGGFDFSADFNLQESTSVRLLASEVYIALQVQKAGGAFVIKVFDISIMETFALLHILRSCYHSFTMTKPHTSRQANSEKYVICKGFHGGNGERHAALLRACIDAGDFAALLQVRVPCDFVKEVEAYNAQFITKQIANISKTIACINMVHSPAFINGCTDQQRVRADAWHKRYSPVSQG